jgi:peptidoglycan/LPS O-acetylase OafA/YrhL/lysophospholipase L1-like esterase
MSGVVAPDRAAPARLPRLGYIPALDGLRALAVIAVLVYHSTENGQTLPGGFFGVDVFFVISGYLITSLLLADWREHGHVDLRRFWFRRARRLLPALFTMLGAVSIFALLFVHDAVEQLRGQVIAALAYVENWYLLFHHVRYGQGAGHQVLLQHVWSLAVEEQFYLLWPLILSVGLAVWGRHRGKLLLAILVGVAASAIEMAVLFHPFAADYGRVFYGTDTRAQALLVGAALAFVWAPWRLSSQTGRRARWVLDGASVGATIALVWIACNWDEYQNGKTVFRGGFLVVALLSALLVAATVHPVARLAPWVFGNPVLRWIGVRSYGIYLWHWPVFMVTRPHSDIELTGIPLFVIRLAITIGLAWASYRYVEEPIRHGAIGRRVRAYRSSRGEARSRMATVLLLGGLALITVTLIIAVGLASAQPSGTAEGTPTQNSTVITPGTATTSPIASSTAPTTAAGTTAPATTAPATTAPPRVPSRVTAIGDSVMQGAAPQLAQAINNAFGGDITLVDAAKNRQFPTGIDAVLYYQKLGVLGDYVVIHLGTNGVINPDDFDRMMGVLSGVKKVAFVNAKEPRAWEQQVNDTLAAGVKRYKNALLVDWHDYGNAHPEFFYDDGIHLRPEGAIAYAQLITNALGGSVP